MKSPGASRKILLFGFVLLLLISAGTLAMVLRSRNFQANEPAANNAPEDPDKSTQAPDVQSPTHRPFKTDNGLAGFSLKQGDLGKEGSAEQLNKLTRVGLPGSAQFPGISAESNPAAASVIEAVTLKKYPERLSPVFAPAAFDMEKYQADPESYLEVHEPGRAFQTAQPASDVPALASVSSTLHRLKQGESVRLSVKTLPGMPATFTSFDNGVFENGLVSQTVAANQQGEATVTFRSSQGQRGEINILAASPVASDKIHFTVFVEPK